MYLFWYILLVKGVENCFFKLIVLLVFMKCCLLGLEVIFLSWLKENWLLIFIMNIVVLDVFKWIVGIVMLFLDLCVVMRMIMLEVFFWVLFLFKCCIINFRVWFRNICELFGKFVIIEVFNLFFVL